LRFARDHNIKLARAFCGPRSVRQAIIRYTIRPTTIDGGGDHVDLRVHMSETEMRLCPVDAATIDLQNGDSGESFLALHDQANSIRYFVSLSFGPVLFPL
jgi:hypothetical protein